MTTTNQPIATTDIWVVRSGPRGRYSEDFLERGFVSIGFFEKEGAAALTLSRRELANRLAAHRPDLSQPQIWNQVSQFHRFVNDIEIGDTVATYEPSSGRILVGTIRSAARHDPQHIDDMPFVRDVEWQFGILRSTLSVSARNTLGSALSMFRVSPEVSQEIRSKARPLNASPESLISESPLRTQAQADRPDPSQAIEDQTLDTLRDELEDKANQFIEDRIASLGPYELQDLVAGILRAMGYKTRVSPPGPDRGVDILASPDGLGLQEPRIFVEVKHRRSSQMGAPEIRSFLGGRQPGDRCLYVSTGGFTREARYEAERSTVPLMLLGLPELQELVVEHYEALDMETKQLVPLTRLYWPVADG